MHDDEPSATDTDGEGPKHERVGGPVTRAAPRQPSWADIGIGALNGVLGDYLVARDNDLAIGMAVYHANEPLRLDAEHVCRAFPEPTAKVCVLVHGLCCTEASWTYAEDPGTSYGTLLREDQGYSPVFVRYNTGLRISENGRALAQLLDQLQSCFPVEVEELTLIGHSMGGLLIRSACLIAEAEGLPWLDRVRRAIYLGSPHRGAPLEKFGNVVSAVLGEVPDPFTRLARDLINRRSVGIKDLRHANLRNEDWEGIDPDVVLTGAPEPVPLRAGIDHYLIAGTLAGGENHLIAKVLGDGLVRVPSATGPTAASGARIEGFPEDHIRLYPGFHHMRLARDPEVYTQLLEWCRR